MDDNSSHKSSVLSFDDSAIRDVHKGDYFKTGEAANVKEKYGHYSQKTGTKHQYLTSRQQAYWFKDDLNLNSNWLRGANWETDDHYDKNPITVDGNNITWSWRYDCDGDDGDDGGDGDDGDDSDDGDDKDTMVTIVTMVTIRTRWWRWWR